MAFEGLPQVRRRANSASDHSQARACNAAVTLDELLGGPFDTVFDIGGNVGDFAEQAVTLWPATNVWSFEPVPHLADANRRRAEGRWNVEPFAVSDARGGDTIFYCVNQHSASTMQRPGSVRRELFDLRDAFEPVDISTVRLDDYLDAVAERDRLLVKIDVEGHEGEVIAGGQQVLAQAATVICEVQNDPAVFEDGVTVAQVTELLAELGLTFAGVLDVLHAPGDGRVLQFDGVWRRT